MKDLQVCGGRPLDEELGPQPGVDLLIADPYAFPYPDYGWALSSLNKLLNYLNYWNILNVCFASFFLASSDVIAYKNLTVSDIMISMHMLYHIMKGIYHSVANRVRYIPTKYH